MLCGVSWLTAAAGDVTFRDLARKYFSDGDGSDLAKLIGYTGAVKEVIALKYKVLLFADGRETAVDPKTHNFKLGDKIRVQIEPLSDYYVYIFHIGASGQSHFLLPAENEEPPTTKANQLLALPADGFLEFTDPVGEETLLVVATETPVANRAVLARVLTKKSGEKDTPEEEAVRKTIKATVKKALKSVRERQKEILDNAVTYRGLTTDTAMQNLVKDVHARGVDEGTFEEPTANGADGTCALYISTKRQVQPKLLVTIPLKSVEKPK